MSINLMSGGRSEYVISIPREAEAPILFAAEELSRYLCRIGGTELPIQIAARQARSIVLSQSLKADSPDAFTIRTEGKKLLLSGASPRGVLYAAYTFLEDCLGCAWLKPGDEHVPDLDEITIGELDIFQQPSFRNRIVVHFRYYRDTALAQIDWMGKRKLNVSFIAINERLDRWDSEQTRERVLPELEKRGIELRTPGHSFLAWLPPTEYFDKHPEYFSLINGERRSDRFVCLSNPDVPREMAKNIACFVEANPETRVITLWHTDRGDEFCECDDCRKVFDPVERALSYGFAAERALGSDNGDVDGDVVSPEYVPSTTAGELALVNSVAAHLEASHPELLIETLAYGRNYNPSRHVKPHANVLINYAVFDKLLAPENATTPVAQGDFHKPTRDYINAWKEQARHFSIYEYYGLFHDFTPLWEVMAKDMKYYRRLGVEGISSEIAGWNELHLYTFARLSWNCDLPWRDILRQYCEAAYGEAADFLFEYWTILQSGGLDWNWNFYRYKKVTAEKPLRAVFAERRNDTAWQSCETTCRNLLRQANQLYMHMPILTGSPASRSLKPLERIRQVQARWEEVPIPWMSIPAELI